MARRERLLSAGLLVPRLCRARSQTRGTVDCTPFYPSEAVDIGTKRQHTVRRYGIAITTTARVSLHSTCSASICLIFHFKCYRENDAETAADPTQAKEDGEDPMALMYESRRLCVNCMTERSGSEFLYRIGCEHVQCKTCIVGCDYVMECPQCYTHCLSFIAIERIGSRYKFFDWGLQQYKLHQTQERPAPIDARPHPSQPSSRAE